MRNQAFETDAVPFNASPLVGGDPSTDYGATLYYLTLINKPLGKPSRLEEKAMGPVSIRCIIARSREGSSRRKGLLICSCRSEIWHAARQQYCRAACQMWVHVENATQRSRNLNTLWYLRTKRPVPHWNVPSLAWSRDQFHIPLDPQE